MREDIIKRVSRAIEWVESNLSDNPAPADAAKIACLSEYHFYRLFRSITGMSLGMYIRKRRLTIAAEKLLSGNSGILELALDVGYESQEAFTRAFKDMFGITPGNLRSGLKDPSKAFQPCFTIEILEHLSEGCVTIEPEFRKFRQTTVTGIGKNIEMGNSSQVDRIWGRFLQEFPKIDDNNSNNTTYGVCSAPVFSPVCTGNNKKDKKQNAEQLHYLAGCEFDNIAGSKKPENSSFSQITLESGNYAVFTHSGSATSIMKTVDYIWRIWLPRSSYDLADIPDFELYESSRFNHETLEGEFEIWVPVKS